MSSRSDKIKELTEKLQNGIKNVFEDENYKKHLKVMSKFHNYSYRNQILISLQNPDATLVKGYISWQKDFKRTVKKGEKGIQIIARCVARKDIEKDSIDKDGNPITENVLLEKEFFRRVTVFDISQTEGEEIENLNYIEELKFDVKDFSSLFNILKTISPAEVYFKEFKGYKKGCYNPKYNKIFIKENMSESHTIKTLIHEIAHAKLHNDNDIKEREELSRKQKEVEAESIAYIVSTYFGIDTSDYSFGYIANWSSNKELKELESSLELISNTANSIIDSIKKQINL